MKRDRNVKKASGELMENVYNGKEGESVIYNLITSCFNLIGFKEDKNDHRNTFTSLVLL